MPIVYLIHARYAYAFTESVKDDLLTSPSKTIASMKPGNLINHVTKTDLT